MRRITPNLAFYLILLPACTNPATTGDAVTPVDDATLALGDPAIMGTEADWTVNGTASNSRFGQAVAVGDLDCDGVEDVAVGAPFAGAESDLTTTTSAFGRVHVYFGSEDDPTAGFTHTAADRAGFGFALAIGDPNGDGCEDLIVGEPAYTSAGRTTVFFGDPTGLSTSRMQQLAAGSYLDPMNAWADARATGMSLSTGGDINGDGLHDLLVGAPWSGTTTRPARGAALVYFGAPTGAPTSLSSNRQALAAPITMPNNAEFGRRVAIVGDVNGDTFDDALIAKSPTSGGGGVYLYLGTSSGLAYLPAWFEEGIGTDLGANLAGLGDLDGNGRAEVAISTGSSILLYRGVSTGLNGSPFQTILAPTGERLASRGLTVADIDGDGLNDLILRTVTLETTPRTRIHAYQAQAWVPGLGLPYNSAPNHSWDAGLAAEGETGPLASGDADGDGDPDIFGGAPNTTASTRIGRVDAFAGGPFPLGDADGDGYDALLDCDDTKYWMHPGATEYCDGYDNNCNSVIDDAGCATDNDPPVGNVRVDHPASPDVAASATGNIVLHFDVHDLGGPVEEMCISDTETCSAWQPFTESLNRTLTGADALKTLYARFKDAHMNVSEAMTVDVFFDRVAPVDGLATGTMAVIADESPHGRIALSWTGFTDATSGVQKYQVRNRADTHPTSCSDGTLLTETSEVNYTHDELVLGQRYYYRICAIDHAGNVSFGVPISKAPAAPTDLARPEGTVSINGGAVATSSGQVTLTLAANDESDVSQMCVSNSWLPCTAWRAFQTEFAWTLAGTIGTQTVYVWFKDEWDNVSARYSDGIEYDPIKPTNGVFKALSGDGRVDVSWAASTDTGTGISKYRLAFGLTLPADCTTAVEMGPTVLDYAHTGLTNGQTYFYRLCAYDGADNRTDSTAYALTRDKTGPSGSLVINEGALATRLADISLRILGTDPSGIERMCVAATPAACTDWEDYNTVKPWTLSPGDGNRYVYLTLEDGEGNRSARLSDYILYDTTAPNDGLITVNGGDRQLTLNWSRYSDARSGIDRYRVVYDVIPVSSCMSGTMLYEGPNTTFTHTGLANGVTYYYRVCAVDKVGNWSVGTSIAKFPAPEYTPPTASISINGGAAATNSRTITVTLTAADTTGVAQFCLSNTSNCTTWRNVTVGTPPTTYSGTFTPWELTEGTGTKTVYAWFKDSYGSRSTTKSDAIILDTIAPNSGILTVAAGTTSGSLKMTWSGASDLLSGVDSYDLRYESGELPADCDDGASVYSGALNTFTHTGLPLGTMAGYRLCVRDRAGNRSAGVTGSMVALSEYVAPTGTIAINSNAYATANGDVILTITGTDPSGVSQMCISNSTTCTAFEAFSTTKAWRLATNTTGTKTVSLWLRDTLGNTSTAALRDTIIFDPSPPTNGRLTATVGVGSVLVKWTGFSDGSGAGIARYDVRYATGTYPATCTAGTSGFSGTGAQANITGLTSGTQYYFRVCAVDRADNVSSGALISAKPN